MHGCVLLVAPSPGGSCREAVRAFLYPMGRSVHAIEARLTKADGVVFTSGLWTVGTREISGIAEEIARWLAAKSRESRDLEATITLRAGRPSDRYSPPNPMRACAVGDRSSAAGRRDSGVTSCWR
jgi:hypothetical protein